ncbi:hypothetical protein [Clostridium sp. UBA5119]|uniref:hypothetical protein n=1 Tax=Clostridium sp. UBA5119 TaxID=1946366 RepID=UPI003217EE3C
MILAHCVIKIIVLKSADKSFESTLKFPLYEALCRYIFEPFAAKDTATRFYK